MDRWEYCISRLKVLVQDDSAGSEEDHLNRAGQDGWRLVHVVPIATNAKFFERHYYFERRLPPP